MKQTNTNDVRFLHIRKHTKTGTLLPTGGATIAVTKADKGYNFYVAQCSDKDVFNKKIGRSVASGRLKKVGEAHFDVAVVKTSLHHLAEDYNTKVGEQQLEALLSFK
jgi:hypothetical protein